jgi:DNA repair exonuclease SbcCD nuclease subunit
MKLFLDHVEACGLHTNNYIYILGNHDMYKPNDSKYHALQTLKSAHNFPTNFVVVDERMDELDFTFVPYMVNPNDFPRQTNKFVFCHQTFFGADFGYVRPEEGVHPESVQGAEFIISGHIHMRQVFKNVIYPGTPYAQSVNDINQSKGVMIFDTDTYKYRFIESPLPQWRKLDIDLVDMSPADAEKHIISNLDPKDHWTIEITGPRAEVMAIRENKHIDALIHSTSARFKPNFTDNNKRLISIKSMNIPSITTEYVDKIYTGSVDKEMLKKEAAKLYSRLNQLDAKQKM